MEDTPLVHRDEDAGSDRYHEPTEEEQRDSMLRTEILCFAERVLHENEQTWWNERGIVDFLSDDFDVTRARIKRLINQLIDEGRVERRMARELPKESVRGIHKASATRGVSRVIDHSRTHARTYLRTNEPRTFMTSDYPSLRESLTFPMKTKKGS